MGLGAQRLTARGPDPATMASPAPRRRTLTFLQDVEDGSGRGSFSRPGLLTGAGAAGGRWVPSSEAGPLLGPWAATPPRFPAE